MNKRIIISVSLIVFFIVNQFVLPPLMDILNWNNEIIYETLSFLSMVSVPVAILVLLHDIFTLRLASIALLLITIAFYILDLTNVSGPLAGYAYLILVVANIAILVLGLLMQQDLYYGRRAGVFFILLFILIFLRYTPLVTTVYVFLDDHNTMAAAGWNLPRAFSIFYSILYFLTFVVQIATLDAVIEEKVKIGYE